MNSHETLPGVRSTSGEQIPYNIHWTAVSRTGRIEQQPVAGDAADKTTASGESLNTANAESCSGSEEIAASGIAGHAAASALVATAGNGSQVAGGHPDRSGETSVGESAVAAAGSHRIGDYLVLACLGRGGMGVIYKARDLRLHRIVALKVIRQGRHFTADAATRFANEARTVAQLNHAGIVQIFEIGTNQGSPFIAFEYVDGCDLQEFLQGRPTSPRTAAAITQRLCQAMQHSHDRGILHRDLKPANILIDSGRVPRITDFGLARHVDGPDAETMDGTVMGSPSYMSPEQAEGRLAAVTVRSDVYSLGAILFQMLTGRPPFLTDRPLDTIYQVIHAEPVLPRDLQPGVPEELQTICMKALRKDPAARYDSAAAFADDLDCFLTGRPIAARPAGPLEQLWRWSRRNPRLSAVSGLCLMALTTTALVSSWAWHVTSVQRGTIAAERDNAERQRDEARRQEKNARVQASNALETVQFVIDDIDTQLAGLDNMQETRLSMLAVLSEQGDRLDLELTGGIRGEVIPTLMRIRFRIAQAFAESGDAVRADQEYMKLYRIGMERILINGRNNATLSNQAKIQIAWAAERRRVGLQDPTPATLLEEAVVLAREARRIAESEPERVVDESDADLASLLDLQAHAAQNLAASFLADGQDESSLPLFIEARDCYLQEEQTLLATGSGLPAKSTDPAPDATDGRQLERIAVNSGRMASAISRIQLQLGRTSDAFAEMEKAIDAQQCRLQRNPQSTTYLRELSAQQLAYGVALLWMDRHDQARIVLEQNLTHCREHAEVTREGEDSLVLARTLYALGVLEQEKGNSETAERHLHYSRGVCHDQLHRAGSPRLLVQLMLAESRFGHYRVARSTAHELAMKSGRSPEIQFERARALAQLSAHARDDLRDELVSDALDAVRRWAASGEAHVFYLQTEPDLDPIRSQAEFQKMLLQMRETPEVFRKLAGATKDAASESSSSRVVAKQADTPDGDQDSSGQQQM
ncbi:MAG: serine/threonine protein kinase [Planctomycetaceae bacterium]|nr:serine/threonine protein kinase [Planctomycetaceae bacterium]